MAVIREKMNKYGGGYRIHNDFMTGERESEEIVKRVSRIVTKSLIRQKLEKKEKA